MKHKFLRLFIFALLLAVATPQQTSAQAFVRPCRSTLSATTLQGFTANMCGALQTSDTVLLTDARNGQAYRVRKFADGHCWMIDNMKLAGVTLTSADSDVTEDVILPAAATSGTTNNTSIQVWDGSAQTYCATASNFAADSTTRCGYHYNWMGATAGTGTAAMTSVGAPMSICPKGWKLPANSGEGSFYNLATAAGFTNNAAGSTALQNDVTGFSGRFFGYYENVLQAMGSNGLYWTRSAHSSNAAHAYYIEITASIVNTWNYYVKSRGLSVRCVL